MHLTTLNYVFRISVYFSINLCEILLNDLIVRHETRYDAETQIPTERLLLVDGNTLQK